MYSKTKTYVHGYDKEALIYSTENYLKEIKGLEYFRDYQLSKIFNQHQNDLDEYYEVLDDNKDIIKATCFQPVINYNGSFTRTSLSLFNSIDKFKKFISTARENNKGIFISSLYVLNDHPKSIAARIGIKQL